MYLYVRIMYQSWSNGQDDITLKARHEVFIGTAAKMFHMTFDEMETYLKNTDWFVY